MAKRDERISNLEARLKQLKAEQARVDARRRATATRKDRSEDVRRKVLVGAVVLEGVARGEVDRTQVWTWLDKGLSRADDRKLFDGLGEDRRGAPGEDSQQRVILRGSVLEKV